MRNPCCVFASSCPAYEKNDCQGCSHASDRPESRTRTTVADVFKKILEKNQYNVVSKPRLVPDIKKVIFNRPVTVVLWDDGSKTIVRCQEDDNWSEYVGLAMAISKKAFGTNESGSNYYDVFKKHLPKEESK